MNTNRNTAVFGLVAVALVAVALSPVVANAQAVEGKFTLPCTTYWNGAVLPAGEYTFTTSPVSKANHEVEMLRVRGAKNLDTVAIARPSDRAGNGLIIERSGSVAVARTMYLADSGQTLQFQPSKAGRELLAQARTETVKVAIAAAE